jgi:hypothetical protein
VLASYNNPNCLERSSLLCYLIYSLSFTTPTIFYTADDQSHNSASLIVASLSSSTRFSAATISSATVLPMMSLSRTFDNSICFQATGFVIAVRKDCTDRTDWSPSAHRYLLEGQISRVCCLRLSGYCQSFIYIVVSLYCRYYTINYLHFYVRLLASNNIRRPHPTQYNFRSVGSLTYRFERLRRNFLSKIQINQTIPAITAPTPHYYSSAQKSDRAQPTGFEVWTTHLLKPMQLKPGFPH